MAKLGSLTSPLAAVGFTVPTLDSEMLMALPCHRLAAPPGALMSVPYTERNGPEGRDCRPIATSWLESANTKQTIGPNWGFAVTVR